MVTNTISMRKGSPKTVVTKVDVHHFVVVLVDCTVDLMVCDLYVKYGFRRVISKE